MYNQNNIYLHLVNSLINKSCYFINNKKTTIGSINENTNSFKT